MRDFDDIRSDYKLTCKDFDYVGVECCPLCHDPEFADYDLRVVKIDGVNALLCCLMVRFFYPKDPGRGMTPEAKLLAAIFGDTAFHYEIDPSVYEDDEFDD